MFLDVKEFKTLKKSISQHSNIIISIFFYFEIYECINYNNYYPATLAVIPIIWILPRYSAYSSICK